MKKDVLPKDLTVRILLTVSLMREPINFYDFSDLEFILLMIAIWMEVAIIRKGVKASVINAIFQQWNRAMNNPMQAVVVLRVTTAMIPVIILWI